MMDELKQQFYEVMHKYQKPFSEEGVTANLTQWYEQKQGLLQLLRRHPLWNCLLIALWRLRKVLQKYFGFLDLMKQSL